MSKLSDKQLIVLSSAAKHDEGLATRPANLNAAAAMKVASSLIAKGLVREIRAKADAPVWHENDDGRFALKITKSGREAIGVDDEHAQDAAPVSPAPAQLRTKKSGSKSTEKKDAQKTSATARNGRKDKPASDDESSPADFRAGSKQAKIVELMKRAKGATLDELVEATDWLPHTTRAALTGLRKRGLAVERVKDEGRGSVYRIKAGPTAKAA
jgi:DNA-binding MarR family transcriptional regulator